MQGPAESEVPHGRAPRDRCETMLLKFIKKSPRIQFILRDMKRRGCPLPTFECRECKHNTGGFIPAEDKVVLCSNTLQLRKEYFQVIIHELIHAYDKCRAEVDWNNCLHHACTELRASSLSGECDFSMELRRGQFGVRNHHAECAKRRAQLSVSMNPACSGKAALSVEQAFKLCYPDTSPFERIPD